jgi:tetraacyldisaccharide 4'-kinase
VHRRLLPEAVVVEDADRLRGARAAAEAGAHVVVLDDAYQRLDVRRDLDVLVVSAESQRAARWTLPAGPWREGWQALGRAGLVAVTRKRAPLVAARAVAQRVAERAPRAHVAIARLGLSGLRGLVTSNSHDASNLADATVLAAAGVGDPESFAEQLRLLGASVRSIRWRDHQPVTEREIARLLEAGATVDYVVVTEKDAAKLRPLWPPDAPEPLVAGLRVVWESGRRAFEGALDAVVSGATEPGRELRRRP